MLKIYYDNDANMEDLKGQTIAVLGYGSQGHAQAQNMKDSGLNVIVGLRPSSKFVAQAKEDGLEVYSIAEACAKADIIHVLLPDEYQGDVYEKDIKPNLKAGDALSFSHGFNIHFKQINPPEDVDVFMIAPKGPGHMVRRLYVEGQAVPGLIAIEQDATGNCQKRALAFGKGVGCTRSGLIETTFAEETETDLFGEQAVLCGGMTELVRAGFDTLVEAGYQPEIAYFECLHEMKLIVDLMYEGGIANMRYSISDTAEFGDLIVGKRLINEDVRKEMKAVLKDIQTGVFAKEWLLDNIAKRPKYNALKRIDDNHLIEEVGRNLRNQMSWLKK